MPQGILWHFFAVFFCVLCVFAPGIVRMRLIASYTSRKDAKNAKEDRKEECRG
jgi:hypothetical protein